MELLQAGHADLAENRINEMQVIIRIKISRKFKIMSTYFYFCIDILKIFDFFIINTVFS